MVPTQVFLLGKGLTGWDAPWAAAGLGASARTLDLGVRDGDIANVRGTSVAISDVVAAEGHLEVGDVMPARLEDTTKASLRVAAIYDRAAGLGHVVMDRGLARRHAAVPADAAVFVAGKRPASHPGTQVLTRAEYLGTVRTLGQSGAWGVWVIIGLSIAFAALSLVNTAAMVTAERRGELATIRLLGGTRLQAIRMVALELAPIVAVGLVAGAVGRGDLGDGRPRGRPRHRADRVRDARGRPGGGRRAARPRRRRRDRPQGDPRHARGGDAGAGVRMERMARSVLVVDDSAPFRATARALLEARGYRVVGAVADGGEALAAVEAMRPDAVLLDINLPDADGIAVAGRLTGAGGPAVVLVSTLDGAALRGAIERSGARGFLPKADLTSPQLIELLGPP